MTEATSRIQRELLRALGLDSDAHDEQTRALFETAISHISLAPQQEAVVSMLLSLNRMSAATSDAADNDEGHDDDDPDSDDDLRRMDLQRLREELRDLREVNDTVAAALGACRRCWGGDAACEECGGRGKSGSTAPDMRLFDRLVVPAVRRVSHQAKEKNG